MNRAKGARMNRAKGARMRVVDAGDAGAYRSQALWHGIASAMRPGAAPTLSFCRPIEPYVGLGYHRSLAELDLETCRRLSLPIIRRQIGGGPVYLDGDQLFFQITLPADRAPGRVDRLYELCLEPAVEAFRDLGLATHRNGANDISIGDRKVSGTGAGRIGDGVTVVGNVIFRFPHQRMVEVLALPGDRLRRECLRLMRRHVSSLAGEGLREVDFDQAREALISVYGRAFGEPREGSLTEAEEVEIRSWEERFQAPEWLAGPDPPPPVARRIKISADAWIVAAEAENLTLEVSIVGGRVEQARVHAEGLDGERIRQQLTGVPARPGALRQALEPFGEDGERILDLLEPLPPVA